MNFEKSRQRIVKIVVQFKRQTVATCGTLLLLIPYFLVCTSFEVRFKETVINSDAHIHRSVTVFQHLLHLDVKVDAESRFSLLHVK